MQPDGFVTKEGAWSDENYKYDYIGAPWDLSFDFPGLNEDTQVGNGGFSFRSRRLLFTTKYLYGDKDCHPEDVVIARRCFPSERVFRRDLFDGVYYHFTYGRTRFRLRPVARREP